MLDIIQEKINQSEPVRLHLGCGSKLFDGYINVDGAYMKGTPGITIHDLLDPFPLPDSCVDEIISVHVIEHIMPDQVPMLMKEWLRVLKPGGFVAVEWPDILKMCQYIVQDPARLYSSDKRVRKRGIAGIFGNIAKYQDPVMLHKWGYSADSMSLLFKDAGFSTTVSETPCHPKTEMCSRVVAYK
jgi:predicted SAM-dependent methyltransferase